jgi:Cytochrome b(N-terminal)/b6/petB
MRNVLVSGTVFLHWGVIQISLANLIVILVMLAVFVLALVLPFGEGTESADGVAVPADDSTPLSTSAAPGPGNWTAALRARGARVVPPGQLLPDRQPVYVTSWIYVFGVLTLAALLVALASGGLLALGGSNWWHVSGLGHFVNSLHLWSVELFFACMVIHLWGKFFMAAWRGGRALTWVTGVLAFLGSIGTAFTGYLTQSNFDAQWISTQAKDGLNAVGVGAWFNVLNPGQMLLWHVVLLPFVIGVITVWHVILVRRHGVVPPLDAAESS